jgi:hypothetical protein
MAALLVGVACQTSAPPETTVKRVLMAPDLPNAPYDTIVIVAATPDRESDRMIEEGLRQELGKRRVEAVSFVRRSSATQPSEDAVRALVGEIGADAVLVVSGRLDSVDIERHGERVDVEPQVRGGSLLDFFRYDYKEITSAAYDDVAIDVRFVSDLYDVDTERRVYSVESATARGLTSYDVVMGEAGAIVRRLAKDGLIR